MSGSLKTEDTTIQTLIRLVSAGARGEKLSDFTVHWQSVCSLSSAQNVTPLLACALLHSPELSCPDALRDYLLSAMRTESTTNMIRRQRLLGLLSELSAAGIQAKILKGYGVADCYRYPESRSSVDTDLLIPLHQEADTIRFFQKHGFRVDPRASTSHHTVCQHPRYGMIELHVSLYSELIRDVWFQNLEETAKPQDPFLTLETPEGTFQTLGHTDQLIFLSLHMVKHFILEALTLRMMLDIALYFSRHRSRIDADRYWNIMEKLSYRKLIGSILQIMVQYGGFRQEDFPGFSPVSSDLSQTILIDMVSGGYLGVKEKAVRHESGMEYNRQLQLKEKSQGQYMRYMLTHKLRSSRKLMFPKTDLLYRRYPIMENHRILIPFVRIYHMFSYILRKFRIGSLQRDIHSDHKEPSEIVKKRMELFRSLDML